MKKMAFIGTGNMGGAIIRAVCPVAGGGNIYIANRTPAKAEELAKECGCLVCGSNAEAAKGAEYVVIGVKPGMVGGVLDEIAPCLEPEQVIVSMAAGVKSADMAKHLPKGNSIVRILPNTPCAIGKGLVLIAPCGNVPEKALGELEGLFAGCGCVGFTDEAHADAGMVMGGCTPAFVYMFIEALADGGVDIGLSRADALKWAAKTVEGAAAMVSASGKHPGALKDAVCSPGGSTIEGVRALEQHGLRSAAMEAVVQAYKKNITLGK